MSKIALFLMTGFGVGYMPFATGTWGSLLPVIALVGLLAGGASLSTINISMAAIAIGFSVLCILATPLAETHFGRKDPGNVVADELAAVGMVFLFLPWRTSSAADGSALGFSGDFLHSPGFWNLSIALAGFIFFRIFDIWKPPPIHAIEKLPSGWGMLLDDLMAGVYAIICLQLFARVGLPRIA